MNEKALSSLCFRMQLPSHTAETSTNKLLPRYILAYIERRDPNFNLERLLLPRGERETESYLDVFALATCARR